MKNIAEAFIKEKLRQKFEKSTWKNKGPASPVGAGTERVLRETLNQEFEKYNINFETFSPKKVPLLLKESDFKKTGPVNSSKLLKVSSKWGQCDLYYENSKVHIMGEVKTTTSAIHNTCGLINKNLTAYRELKAEPLAIVLYPDNKVETLLKQHTEVIEGLRYHKIISEEEENKLKECFFILTKIRYKYDLQKRIDDDAIVVKSDADIEQIIKSRELLKTGDLNCEEWKRLLNHIRDIIK